MHKFTKNRFYVVFHPFLQRCLQIDAVRWYLVVCTSIQAGNNHFFLNISRPSQPASASALIQPSYIFVSNTSGSCPALAGQRLLTVMNHGDSFEGNQLTVFYVLQVLCILYHPKFNFETINPDTDQIDSDEKNKNMQRLSK